MRLGWSAQGMEIGPGFVELATDVLLLEPALAPGLVAIPGEGKSPGQSVIDPGNAQQTTNVPKTGN